MLNSDHARTPAADSAPIAETLIARALTIIAAVHAALLVVPMVHNWIDENRAAVAMLLGQEAAIGAALWLRHLGRPRAGACVFTVGAWLLTFGMAAFAGKGTRDVVLLALAPILLCAGVLVNRRFLWTLTALSVAALAGLWFAEHAAGMNVGSADPAAFSAIIDASVILIVTATATSVVTTDLRRTRESEKRHAAALERSELRFRNAIEFAADGILLADEQGTITEANGRVCEMLGRSRIAVLGQSIFELLPGAECSSQDPTRDCFARGEGVTCERTLHRAGAAAIVVETSWQRLPDRSLQCFVRDISARRRLEEQLRHAQKMEAVGTLAGGIAHDFNNLITVMRGFLELMESDPALPEEIAGHVGELKGACDHGADLTQQLLAFAGRRPLQRRAMDVRDLLASNQRLMARLVGDSIKVVIEAAAAPCPVHVDPGLFTQVLLNLAANSRDAMPGGGRITLASLPIAARSPAGSPTDGFVVRDYTGIRFSDTGAGIDPAALDRIFEPFFTTKPEGRNTGLGLAMVQAIVERHGGWVEVASESGRGTTFQLFLPVHVPPEVVLASAPTVPETSATPAPAAGVILVVDDDAGMRRLARLTLTQAGFTVIEAESGPEALETWQEHEGNVDLVFTDMVMPGGMHGLQVIEACRSRKPGVPAILTSGYTLPPLVPGAAAPADVVMLAKPYANAVLIDAVRALMRPHPHVAGPAGSH